MSRPTSLSIVVAVLGVALVTVGGFTASWTSEWVASMLLTVGAAIALAVAFYWLNRTFDRHLHLMEERVESTEEAVGLVEERVGQVAQDVHQQRLDLDELLRERLDPKNHGVARLIEAAHDRKPSSLSAAIRAAREEGSLGYLDPIVALRGADGFWVRVVANQDALDLQLGRATSPPEVQPILMDDDNVTEALTQLGRQAQSVAGQTQPDVGAIFDDVADLLAASRSHESRKTLFARVGNWGATVGYVVSLDAAREPPFRARAMNNPTNPMAKAPRNLSPEERADYRSAQSIAVDPHSLFARPTS